MDHRMRRIFGVLAMGVIWAVLWPAAGLAIVGVLALFLGANGDVGPVEIVQILAPLGLTAGLVFGTVLAVVEPRPSTGPSPLRILMFGLWAAAATGIVADLQPNAIMNAIVLGAIAAPASVAIAAGLRRHGALPA